MPRKRAQDSQIFSNFWVVSARILESISWVIIHKIFLLAANMEVFGCLRALAIVSFSLIRIKWISFCLALGI